MNSKLLLGAAAGALILSGVAITSTQQKTTEAAAPFLHPIALIRSICGDDGEGLAKRRAFFVSAAAAYAEEADNAEAAEEAASINEDNAGAELDALENELANEDEG